MITINHMWYILSYVLLVYQFCALQGFSTDGQYSSIRGCRQHNARDKSTYIICSRQLL